MVQTLLALVLAGYAAILLATPSAPSTFWRDTEPPPALQAVNAVTGSSGGEITVTTNFPANVSDYARVDVRRVAGATAPNVNCSSNGTIQTSYVGTYTPDPSTYMDTGTAGSYYSYRWCIYDGSGNLTASQTVTNVQALQTCGGDLAGTYCWYQSGSGQSCDTYCGAGGRGGCNAAGVSWGWASVANCQAVATAVNGAPGSAGGAGSNNIGCWNIGASSFRDLGGATCGGSFSGNTRYCACNN
jgi:hypothetical protein